MTAGAAVPVASGYSPSPAFGGFDVDSPRLRKIRRISLSISGAFHVLAILLLFLWSTGVLQGPAPEDIEIDITDIQKKPLLTKLPPEIKQIKNVQKLQLSEVPIVSEKPPPVEIPAELMKHPELTDFDLGDTGAGGPVMIGKGGDIVAPQAIRKIDVKYPENMRKLGREARVKVAFTVHKDGSVSDIKIAEGPQEFGQAIVDALRICLFTPATRKGRPLSVRLSMKFNFKLTGGGQVVSVPEDE